MMMMMTTTDITRHNLAVLGTEKLSLKPQNKQIDFVFNKKRMKERINLGSKSEQISITANTISRTL